MFSDNVWDFNGYVDVNHLSGARLMINFEAFSHKPRMLYTAKQFVSNELLSYKFSTAKRNYEGLVRFVKYVDEIRPSLKSFSEITREILLEYYMYLLNAKNETTG